MTTIGVTFFNKFGLCYVRVGGRSYASIAKKIFYKRLGNQIAIFGVKIR